jgi:hypothetical protein
VALEIAQTGVNSNKVGNELRGIAFMTSERDVFCSQRKRFDDLNIVRRRESPDLLVPSIRVDKQTLTKTRGRHWSCTGRL